MFRGVDLEVEDSTTTVLLTDKGTSSFNLPQTRCSCCGSSDTHCLHNTVPTLFDILSLCQRSTFSLTGCEIFSQYHFVFLTCWVTCLKTLEITIMSSSWPGTAKKVHSHLASKQIYIQLICIIIHFCRSALEGSVNNYSQRYLLHSHCLSFESTILVWT